MPSTVEEGRFGSGSRWGRRDHRPCACPDTPPGRSCCRSETTSSRGHDLPGRRWRTPWPEEDGRRSVTNSIRAIWDRLPDESTSTPVTVERRAFGESRQERGAARPVGPPVPSRPHEPPERSASWEPAGRLGPAADERRLCATPGWTSSPEWIVEKTGITPRHLVGRCVKRRDPGDSTPPAQHWRPPAGVPGRLTRLVVSTFSGDYLFPPLSAQLHRDLGRAAADSSTTFKRTASGSSAQSPRSSTGCARPDRAARASRRGGMPTRTSTARRRHRDLL